MSEIDVKFSQISRMYYVRKKKGNEYKISCYIVKYISAADGCVQCVLFSLFFAVCCDSPLLVALASRSSTLKLLVYSTPGRRRRKYEIFRSCVVLLLFCSFMCSWENISCFKFKFFHIHDNEQLCSNIIREEFFQCDRKKESRTSDRPTLATVDFIVLRNGYF